MKIKTSLIFIFSLIITVSCDKKRVFDKYKSVGSSWHVDSIVTFELPKLDAKKAFNLYINVRNNDAYPFNNLFLIVSLEHPNRKVKVDTLEYQMTNPEGKLLGEGFSDIKESKLFYKAKSKFSQKGMYKIHIQQATRQTGKIEGVTELLGITDIGFRIESIE